MQQEGLGKEFHPVKYYFMFLRNMGEASFFAPLGGWAIFGYRVLARGFENAVRTFRGSHDLDLFAEDVSLINYVSQQYDSSQLSFRETHLSKYSLQLADHAISLEENSLLSQCFITSLKNIPLLNNSSQEENLCLTRKLQRTSFAMKNFREELVVKERLFLND